MTKKVKKINERNTTKWKNQKETARHNNIKDINILLHYIYAHSHILYYYVYGECGGSIRAAKDSVAGQFNNLECFQKHTHTHVL